MDRQHQEVTSMARKETVDMKIQNSERLAFWGAKDKHHQQNQLFKHIHHEKLVSILAQCFVLQIPTFPREQ